MDDDIFLPAEIDVIHARLPQLYQAAKAALAECDRIDECREWQNKHDAIASYARQANDTQLETYARRIKARAARQCGKLLSEVDARKNGGTVVLSRTQAAADAGLSERQRITATRIYRVPDEEFEAAVEAEKPLSLSKIAALAPRPPREPVQTLTSGVLAEMARKGDAGRVLEALIRTLRSRASVDDIIDVLLDEKSERRRPEMLDAIDFASRFLQELRQAVAARGIGRKTTPAKAAPSHLRPVS